MKSVLVVNPPKINNPKFYINLLHNNSVITCKDSLKYFGVTIDGQPKFQDL